MTWVIQQIATEQADSLVGLPAQVHAIHAEALPDRYRADPDPGELLALLQDWMAGDDTATLGAVSPNGAVLGCLISRIERRGPTPLALAQEWSFVDLVVVDEAWRRSEIGLALIEDMKTRLRAQGVAWVRAEYVAFNTASAALLRRAGLAPFVFIAEGRV